MGREVHISQGRGKNEQDTKAARGARFLARLMQPPISQPNLSAERYYTYEVASWLNLAMGGTLDRERTGAMVS